MNRSLVKEGYHRTEQRRFFEKDKILFSWGKYFQSYQKGKYIKLLFRVFFIHYFCHQIVFPRKVSLIDFSKFLTFVLRISYWLCDLLLLHILKSTYEVCLKENVNFFVRRSFICMSKRNVTLVSDGFWMAAMIIQACTKTEKYHGDIHTYIWLCRCN